MDKHYWDSLAESFSDDVLEVIDADIHGVLKDEIKNITSGRKNAVDFGCGPGSLIPHIAPHVKELHAVDCSSKLLKKAESDYNAKNVKFHKKDLGKECSFEFKTETAFCINVLIHESDTIRKQIIKNIRSACKKGADLVTAVPSYESILHVYQTLIRINEQSNGDNGISKRSADQLFRKEVKSPTKGLVSVGETVTKCWMQDELKLFLSDNGFIPDKICRVEYSWNEEIENPPKSLDAPNPWDWLIVAKAA